MPISRANRLYIALRQLRNRSVILRKNLRDVHKTAYVHSTSRVASDLRAGPYVFIGRRCEIGPLVAIGPYTMLASEVAIVGADHNWNKPSIPMQFAGRPTQNPTEIGADVWIGHRATIMCGLQIGDGAIVGAGAVVTKHVPEFEVWAGVPARRIGNRFLESDADSIHRAMLSGPLVAPSFAQPKTALWTK